MEKKDFLMARRFFEERCFLYHSVGYQGSFSLTPQSFEKQMALLHRKGYSAITVENMLAKINANESLNKLICLTFDDGYRDFFDCARPIMAKYGFSATVFIPSAKVSRSRLTPNCFAGREMMCWEDLEVLIREGYEIGSHSAHHPNMVLLSEKDCISEIVNSRDELQRNLKVRILGFSYPGGAFSLREMNFLKQYGYEYAMGIAPFFGSERNEWSFSLARVPMQEGVSLSFQLSKVGCIYRRLRNVGKYIQKRLVDRMTIRKLPEGFFNKKR